MQILFLSVLVLLGQIAYSQEYETVVEGIVFNSSSKVVIDEKTIRESNAPDLISLITTQANITLFNNNFQPPQLFLRGGEASHVLFVIDGVPVFDPSWAQRTLNLNILDITNVKRIEILKGGQTVLYGGQALAGVIKIETFGREFQTEGKVLVTGGLPVDSFDRGLDDRRLGASYETTSEDKDQAFKASGRLMQRKAQSPVLDSDRLYDQWTHNLDLGYQKKGPVAVQLRGFYFKDKSWNPTTALVAGRQTVLDSDVQRQDEQVGASGVFHFLELPFTPRLALFGQKGWRYFFSESQPPPSASVLDANFRSGLQGANFEMSPLQTETFNWRVGATYQREDLFLNSPAGTLTVNARRDEKFQETRALFTQVQWGLSKYLLFETGARFEKVSHLPEYRNYQVGLTLFENTRVEWVTGFRAPSIAQKYGLFENPELRPETSQTYSLTQDIPIPDRGELSVTLFETSFNDFIETRPAGGGVLEYQNTARVKTRGVEATASFRLDESSSLQTSYAYQEPRDQVRHETLRRRPFVSGSARYLHAVTDWSWMLEGTGVGTRYDFFGASRATFPGYFLINSNVRYRLDAKTNLSLRVNNWLDFRPEISIDFYGEGRSALLTVERVF